MADQVLQLPREGERVGSGIVLSLISTGGSAYVYKTWNESLELHRAVKVMSPDAEPDVRDRFATEARLNSKLQHPHIVQCHNFGTTEGGLPFLEMEYLPGPALADLLEQRGPMPTPVALAATLGILEALSYAHTLRYTLYEKQHTGLIHRDLKPANIVLAADGTVKLMDFGIARPVDTSLHTIAGTVPGTVAYMSPEACAGHDCDFRSDIYQLGLCLYEFATAQPAFPQADLTSLLQAKSSNTYAPPQSVAKGVDPRIVTIITKCLQLDPANRYASAHVCFLAARSLYDTLSTLPPRQLLLDFLEGKPFAVSSSRPRNRLAQVARPAATAAAVVATVSLAAAAVLHFAPGLFTQPPSAVPAPVVAAAVAPTPQPAVSIAPSPVHPAAVTHPRTTVPKRPAPVRVPPQHDNSAQVTDTLPSTDAAYDISAGKRLYEAADYSGALTSLQAALRKPSSRPRQDIVRQAVYWSARCNTALYAKSAIPVANYAAAWKAVTAAFSPGSAEHAEALRHLEESTP